jgi:deoxyhypusine monooxygenase
MDKLENRDNHILVLENENSIEEDKIQSIFALMNIADTASLNAIIKVLEKDDCPVVRHEAAFALGETASKISIEALKKSCLNDKDTIVIHECLLAIGTMGDKSEKEFIEKFINNPDFIIKQTAKIALQRLNYTKKPYSGVEEFKNL